jgi:hypothetical protein
MAESVGLSIGATNLAVVAPPRCPAARRSVLTLYRHRPPEVGVPSDNPNLNEPGLVITGFVERVGDPVPIAAADGSIHRGETLVAKALRALCYEMTNGRPAAAPASVAFPAHWDVPTVEALRAALTAFGEWPPGANHLPLVSDATAALTALQAEPGLPARGVIALCDFGGTGTSITLADAADGYRSIGATVRHVEFSGDAIDHALLMHVIADLSVGSPDDSGTSAIASLTRLRSQCRGAKEQLSATSVCSFVADAPGYRGTIRLTRNELDDLLRRPLAQVIGDVQEALHRNGIRPADLVGVGTAGGGAAIPAVTTALSEQLRVPVITTRWPQLTAAGGAARLAARDPGDDVMTAAAPVLTAAAAAAADDTVARSSAFPALAWSQEDDSAAESLPVEPYVGDCAAPQQTYWPRELSSVRPQLQFQSDESVPRGTARAPQPWYRRPLVAAAAATALTSLTAWSVGLRNDSTPLWGTPSTPVRSTPATTAPAAASPQQDPGQPGPAQAVMQATTPVAQIRPIEPPAVAAQAPDLQANPALPPPDSPIIMHAPAVPQAPTTTDAPTTTQATTTTQVPTTTQAATSTPPTTTTQTPTTTQPPTTTQTPTTTQMSTTPRPPTTTQVPTTTQPPPTQPSSPRPSTTQTPSTTARPPG